MSVPEPEILDDADALAARDSGNLLWQLATAGAEVRRAQTATVEAGLSRLRSEIPPRALLVATDGVHADSGRLVVTAAAARAPALVWDDSELPQWAGSSDALLVGCQQGMSARLARLVDAAQRRGLAIAVAAPPQSAVGEAAGRQPLVAVDPQIHPLAARWSVLTPLLVAAAELGVVAEPRWSELADQLDATCYECRPAADSYANQAKSLALQLMESLPVVVGNGTLATVAAETIAHSFQRIAGLRALWATMPNGADRIAAVLAESAATSAEDDFFADRVEDAVLKPRLILVGGERAPLRPAEFGSASLVEESPDEAAARQALSALQAMAERSNLRSWPVEVPEATALTRYGVATTFGDFAAAYVALATGRSTAETESSLL
ncbi:phosphoglucose isomerase-like protein [Jatrophihabitans sp. GAS493]|uniref:SIS domain-containing protein n=1 Tax=Jatrophihabitans sp. GAS493 TaxID=1907575 RepID=UPI000BB6D984|nr:SIS domain-containing protein [Jatrophihabitans sp. GAS493]SOD73088.1 phosphoglucose isomerase-like protein [Jatrophihabitans sp. GAS493]